MDPMTMLMMALQVAGPILSSTQKAGAASDAAGNAQQNLAYQRQQAKQAQKLASATKTDPYGNELRLIGNKWVYDLTPTTKGLLGAEQQEMLKNLTEDAFRNRGFRERMDEMSKGAGEDYNRLRNEYRYGERPREDDIVNDVTREIMLARRQGVEDTQGTLAKQALRMNNSSAIPGIVRAGAKELGGGLEEAVLKGRRLGRQEFQNASGFRDRSLLSPMAQFQQVARGTPQANISKSGLFGDLGNMASNANTNLINALRNSSGVNSASSGVNSTMAGDTGFDASGTISALVKVLGQLQKSKSPGDAMDPWEAEVTDAEGNLIF